jgi:hypothetical protein
VVAALTDRLSGAQVLPELRVPHVALSGREPVSAYLSRNTRKTLRRARNKIDLSGLTVSVDLLHDADEDPPGKPDHDPRA